MTAILRNVPKTFTFEDQRIEINEIALDLYNLKLGTLELADFSVVTGAAVSGGGLSYDDTTGIFTFNPTDVSSFLTSFTETDPIFVASPAYGITSTNITNWNNAHSWGDHSLEGYLKAADQSDWNATSGLAEILNKPTLFSGSYTDLTNRPTLFSGSYTDLTNKPTIPAAQVQADWNELDTADISYIQNKPTIPTVPTDVSAFNNDAGYLTSYNDTNTTYSLDSSNENVDDVKLTLVGSNSSTDSVVITKGNNITFSNVTTGGFTISATGGGGSGTVTSIATGTGLTGGPITSTGTIALDATIGQLTNVNVSGANAPSDGQVLKWVQSASEWQPSNDLTAGGGGATNFTDLNDTPSSFSNADNKWIRVRSGQNTLEFIDGNLQDLNDVVYTGNPPLPSGDVLAWNGSNWTNTTLSIPSNVSDLSDVSNASPGDGEALLWDAGNSLWVPGAVSGGGGATDKIEENDTSVECIDDGTGDRIVFKTAATEAVQIDANRQILISGTQSGNNVAKIYNDTDGAGTGVLGIYASSNNATPRDVRFYSGGGTANEIFRIGKDGQIGVGGDVGTAGEVLTSGGSSGAATWSAASGGATTLNALTDVNAGSPGDGQVLKWQASTSKWIAAADQTSTGGTGISLTDLSRTNASPAAVSKLEYDNTTGVFTYTPPLLTGYLTAEADTLATVTSRGSSTTNNITVGGNGSTGGITLSDGSVAIRTGTGNVAAIDLYCEVNNAHKVSIKAPAHSAFSGDHEFVLPPDEGTSGYLLSTDGSGTTSWVAPPSGGGVTDGDKGAIVVSQSGATWTLDATLNELSNVSVSSPQLNDVLKWDGSQWTSAADATGGGVTDGDKGAIVVSQSGATWTLDAAITELSDVSVSSPSIGQVLKYNGTNWVNGTDANDTAVSDGDKGDITVSNSGATWNIDSNTIGTTELSATGTTNSSTYLRGDNTWQPTSDLGVSDGNKGAIVVSQSGATWTLDATLNEISNVSVSSPSSGEVLQFNGSNWVAATVTSGNPTISTDSGNAWHQVIFVDSSTNGQQQLLKMDNDTNSFRWNASTNTLLAQTLQSYRFTSWNNDYGSTGQFLMSNGALDWEWTSHVEQKSNGELLLKNTSTSLEGGHLQFEDLTGAQTFAIDVYGSTAASSVIRIIDQNSGQQRFCVNRSGAFGIGHISASYGSSGQVLISQGSGSQPIWGNLSSASSAGLSYANDADIDDIYTQLNAIGNDASITTVAQIKAALAALVRG